MCANVGATSRQQGQNIDDSQRDAVRKKDYNPKINLNRLISKNSLRNGLIKQRRSLL